jgi:hypothetical protein
VTACGRDDAPFGWRTPAYSNTSHYRCLLEAVRYMLLRGAPSRAGSALAPEQVRPRSPWGCARPSPPFPDLPRPRAASCDPVRPPATSLDLASISHNLGPDLIQSAPCLPQVKRVTFGLREAMMAMVVDDLKVVKAVGPEDTALISIATQQLALAAVKAADAAHIPAPRLAHVRASP